MKELIYSECPVDGPRELPKACQTMIQITDYTIKVTYLNALLSFLLPSCYLALAEAF